MNHIIKVTLAEDGDALRRSLADSLREQPDISVLGEAAEGGELVALCRETPTDVAVVDIRMPGMDGVAACKILRSELPEVRLLILTTFDDDEYLRELFGLGVDGYLLKTGSPPRLAEAVRGVYNGLGAVDAGVSRKLGRRRKSRGQAPSPRRSCGQPASSRRENTTKRLPWNWGLPTAGHETWFPLSTASWGLWTGRI